jgi:hypothetical protein
MRSFTNRSTGMIPAPIMTMAKRFDPSLLWHSFCQVAPAAANAAMQGATSSGDSKASTVYCSFQSSDRVGNSAAKTGGNSQGDAPPSAKQASQEDLLRESRAIAIAAKLESSPLLGELLVNRLNGDSRRRMLVAGAAREWYEGEAVGRQFSAADQDRDNAISPNDYHIWVHRSLLTTKVFLGDSKIPFRIWLKLAFVAACPFIAFGLIDNSVMLLSGDAIDSAVGDQFRLTPLAAAALGGVCSGVVGIQMHGFAERGVQYLGLTFPTLTPSQARAKSCFRAKHFGASLGMATGLLCGMWPLLIVKDKEEKRRHTE